jgi:hypothetical protein
LRKLPAILFLAILLFNFYGYRLMIDCMQNQHAALLESKLDNQQYSDDELISIKTPLNLPYYTSSSDYERAYGSVDVNGVLYEYVKRRVNQDTLELLCLPDKAKMHLQSVKNTLFKISIDGTSQQDQKSNTVKIPLPNFCEDINAFALSSVSEKSHDYFSLNTAFLKADYSSKGEQPPEAIC